MLHVYWAIRHTVQSLDKLPELHNIQRNDLHLLQYEFGRLVEELDPSRYWDLPASWWARNDKNLSALDKLESWDAHLSNYMQKESKYSSIVSVARTKPF